MGTELSKSVVCPIVVGDFWKSQSIIVVPIEEVLEYLKVDEVLGCFSLNSRCASFFCVRLWF